MPGKNAVAYNQVQWGYDQVAYHDREAYFEEVHEGELVSVLLSHASADHVGARAYQGTVTS